MRKLFLILLLTMALAPCAAARMTSILVGGGAGSGTACEEAVSVASSGIKTNPLSRYGGDEFLAGEFLAGDWGAINKIQWKGYEAFGADVDAKTFTLALYSSTTPSNINGDPDSSLGSCTTSGSVWGNQAANANYAGCTLSSPVQLTNGTYYHVVISQPTFDGTNYLVIYYDDTNGDGFDFNKDADGSETWSPIDADTVGPTVKLYKGSLCTGN